MRVKSLPPSPLCHPFQLPSSQAVIKMIGGSCDSASASSCCVSVCVFLCVCVRFPERAEEVCWFNGGYRKCQAPLISSLSRLSLPLPHLCPPPASLTHPHVQMHRLHAGDELWAFCGDDVMSDYRECNRNVLFSAEVLRW